MPLEISFDIEKEQYGIYDIEKDHYDRIIEISNIKVINYDDKDILAQFTQSYNSDSFSDVVNKHFTVTLVGDVFKITGEYTLK